MRMLRNHLTVLKVTGIIMPTLLPTFDSITGVQMVLVVRRGRGG